MINVFRSLKKIKTKSKKAYDDQFKKDPDGRYILSIKTDKVDSLMEEYEVCGHYPITSDFFEHLENYVQPLKIQARFNIYIETCENEYSDSNNLKKERFTRSFKHHYIIKSIELETQKKRNKLIAWICSSIFLIFFTILIVAEYFFYDAIPDFAWEVLVIIEWVFGWEVVDRVAFREFELNAEELKCYHLYNSNIRFKKQTKKSTQDILKSFDPLNISYFKKIEKKAENSENKEKKKEDSFEKKSSQSINKIDNKQNVNMLQKPEVKKEESQDSINSKKPEVVSVEKKENKKEEQIIENNAI